MVSDIGGHMSIHLIVILVSFWVGSIIFFSSIIAPTIFKSVDEKNAGYFLRAFFPKYYYFGLIMGLLSILILIFNDLIGAMDYQLILMLVSMIILSIISLKMIPLINNARDLGEQGKSTFDRLHLVSVMLNVVTLLIGLVFLYIV
tara:strand:- start:79 stop:513 length:435 start_codon:yes stop_codon:yes gene_type:complete